MACSRQAGERVPLTSSGGRGRKSDAGPIPIGRPTSGPLAPVDHEGSSVTYLRPERVDRDHIRITVRLDGLSVEGPVVIDRHDPRFAVIEAEIVRRERRKARRR